MELMLVLYEDPELVATEQQRQLAVQHVGEYAMGLLGDGTLKGQRAVAPGHRGEEGAPADEMIENMNPVREG